jgi:serine/threonine protein kinase KIN1/2
MPTVAEYQSARRSAHASEGGGASAPPHGALAPGDEYDMPVQRAPSPGTAPARTEYAQGLSPSPRRTTATTNGAKSRPVSMPPQAASAAAAAAVANGANERRADDAASGHKPRQSASKSTRSSNRVLGDYTLSKSLGQGSMGKVKLAHHNITGQKVN